ncbi:hypothetical protein SLEP1_g56065 [Rubroshorea leprosula]|uniref:Uncharacterized protein n=1 Tax=Rubroshorea leprosula TaxID=152421 RepID=A0AAV5MIF5_9ROSI|nr:hypothetical protein SLEP1_g56065 [Rubroshorea leprosula]
MQQKTRALLCQSMMPICPVLLVFSACEARMGATAISGAEARDWGGIIAGSGAQQGKQSAGDLVQSAEAGAGSKAGRSRVQAGAECRRSGRRAGSRGVGARLGHRCRAGAARLGVRGGDDGSVHRSWAQCRRERKHSAGLARGAGAQGRRSRGVRAQGWLQAARGWFGKEKSKTMEEEGEGFGGFGLDGFWDFGLFG